MCIVFDCFGFCVHFAHNSSCFAQRSEHNFANSQKTIARFLDFVSVFECTTKYFSFTKYTSCPQIPRCTHNTIHVAERDRLKPAPPPKPASLSPGQYDGRHIYRDLQLTPEMYNQLRGLQKKAKDLRAEVRNLRRMSQAQAHSVRETVRDTFIKIRAMLLAGGEQIWQAGEWFDCMDTKCAALDGHRLVTRFSHLQTVLLATIVREHPS